MKYNIHQHSTPTFLILLLTVLQITTHQIHFASAFPGAAGHCDTGDLAGKNSGHGEDGGGPLSNGQLRMKFDNQILRSYETLQLNANQEYDVTLDFSTTNSAFFFRGFLIRLSGVNGEDAGGSFYVGSDSNAQEKGNCDADVSAMTHTNNDNKISVSFKFQYLNSSDANLKLEVTVVRERAANNWFHNFYALQIGEGDVGGDTTAPSQTPGDTCNESVYRFKIIKNDGKKIWRNCTWAGNKPGGRCKLEGVSAMCPYSCGTCDNCVDSSSRMKFYKANGDKITRDCNWTANKPNRCNSVDNMSYACRATCGEC